MEDVQPQEIDQVWGQYIVRGKLTLVESDAGVGKSLAMLQLAAQVSRGGKMFAPEGPGHRTIKVPRGTILFLACEDDLEDTVRPRLDALDADLGRILFADEDTARVDLADVAALGRCLETHKPLLMIVDPISAYCGATDCYRQNEVTDLLLPVRMLARKHHVAIVLVRHLGKEQKRGALHDGIGSVGFASVARSVLRLGVDPDHEEVGAMFHVKCSYARPGRPLGFVKESVGSAGVLKWTGPTSLTLEVVRQGRPKPNTGEQRALELKRHLETNGPQLASVICDRMSWTLDALKAARKAIGAESFKLTKEQSKTGKSAALVGGPGQEQADAIAEYTNGKVAPDDAA